MYIKKCINIDEVSGCVLTFQAPLEPTGLNSECRTEKRDSSLSEQQSALRRCNWLVNRKYFIFTTTRERRERNFSWGLFLMLHKKLFPSPHEEKMWARLSRKREWKPESLGRFSYIFILSTRRKSLISSFFSNADGKEADLCMQAMSFKWVCSKW